MKKSNLKLQKNIFIAVFIVLSLAIFAFFNNKKNTNIKSYLYHQTKDFVSKYNTLYRYHKEISEIIYLSLIKNKNVLKLYKDANTKDVKLQTKIRKELYTYLKDEYKQLKRFNLKQLHFHLKNNDSFLRMHKPKKFGDNLSKIRPTVAYVNKNIKEIDTFEEGRIYNGYRFVYPLKYQGNHIGSIEISFSAKVFTSAFMSNYDEYSSFLVSKNIVDEKVFSSEKSNYIKSDYKDFYLDKEAFEVVKKLKPNSLNLPKPSKKILEIANKKIKMGKPFSIYSPNREHDLIYIPVKNKLNHKVVASLVISTKDTYIKNEISNTNMSIIVTILVLFFILLFIYTELRQKAKLQKQTQKEQKINQKLHQKEEELKILNKSLELKVADAIKKTKQREKLLQEQSRLAQMGEMISMIAHQWRQPLSAISATSGSIMLKAQLGKLDKKSTIDLANNITKYAQHLSSTIDDFRNFFKDDKTKQIVTLEEIAIGALNIVESSMASSNIKINLDINSNEEILTYKNELMQVVLNIIKNAEDALIENNITNPTINIKITNKTLLISDNAGGIPQEIITRIFEPYFSTKTKKDGTGLGLYMSKTIVEDHCGGELSVYNDKDGAVFQIQIVNSAIDKELLDNIKNKSNTV